MYAASEQPIHEYYTIKTKISTKHAVTRKTSHLHVFIHDSKLVGITTSFLNRIDCCCPIDFESIIGESQISGIGIIGVKFF